MRHFVKMIPALFLWLSAVSCQPLVNDPTKPELSGGQGNIIFSCRGRSMQCLSQCDNSGKTVVLLKSLEANTTVEFEKITCLDSGTRVATAIMKPKEGFPSCGDDMTVQHVGFMLEPRKVDTISLKGKVVYESDNMVVMISE